MRRLIIDTDTANDDCVALMLGLLHPEAQLEAITICAGNVDFDQQVENALYTIEVCGRSGQVPVYPGCRQPFIGPHVLADYVHGKDGMGEHWFPRARQRPEREHAVDEMVRRVNEAPGEITICAIGPLTNLAMAWMRDPSISRKVKDVFIMGGTNVALGNITPAAEYNFYVDPEAAHIVFTSGMPITMVGWEIALRYATLDEAEQAEVRAIGTRLAQFLLEVNDGVRRFNAWRLGLPVTTHPDSITLAMALDERVIARAAPRHVGIELCGKRTRGMSVVDELGASGVDEHGNPAPPPNARVVLAADKERFKQVLFSILR